MPIVKLYLINIHLVNLSGSEVMLEKKSQLYAGKAKSVYTTNEEDKLILLFRNDTSAFNGEKIEQLDRKGMVNNKFNASIMLHLKKEGINTHFVERISDQESVVKRLKMFPIECVVRNIAAGSICKRLGIEEGRDLDPPIFEFFLKDDKLGDPMINAYHIETLGLANKPDVELMVALSFKINTILKALFLTGNILLVDYKLEFGLFKGDIVLGDEFTPDGCRLWDKDTRQKLDKDRFRQGLGGVVESYEEVGRRLGIEF